MVVVCYCQVQMVETNSYYFEWRWFCGFPSNVLVAESECESAWGFRDIITENKQG